jgi:hypothetical protein
MKTKQYYYILLKLEYSRSWGKIKNVLGTGNWLFPAKIIPLKEISGLVNQEKFFKSMYNV